MLANNGYRMLSDPHLKLQSVFVELNCAFLQQLPILLEMLLFAGKRLFFKLHVFRISFKQRVIWGNSVGTRRCNIQISSIVLWTILAPICIV